MFGWLAKAGGVDPADMPRTFNCGIGMVLVVAPGAVEAVTAALEQAGETVFRIGRMVAREEAGKAVLIDGLEARWNG